MTKIPMPGTKVRGSNSGDPIMALFDLLGRRWAMGIVWTLAKKGPMTFRELQAHCESISPGVLNTRLKELRLAHLVDHSDIGYNVTELGAKLFLYLNPIGDWAEEWAIKLKERGAKKDSN